MSLRRAPNRRPTLHIAARFCFDDRHGTQIAGLIHPSRDGDGPLWPSRRWLSRPRRPSPTKSPNSPTRRRGRHGTFTPDIVIPTVVVALIYGIGMLRRRGIAAPLPGWRHAAFFGGLAAVFLALQSPVDPIAERLFWMHQIQHLLLRMAGPMLIALSWPQGVLSAGLRATVGTNLLKPIVSNRVVRGIFGVLANPAVATILFIAALYVWQLPRYHNLAIVDDGVHYVMHVTMLLAGLLFWWLVFDRRSAPQGLGYGKRLMMLWFVTLSNILLGAYTVLKGTVLYGAYDIEGRLFGIGALADEQLGGIIIWIPGSMMCLIGILIVVHMWGRPGNQDCRTRCAMRLPSPTSARARSLRSSGRETGRSLSASPPSS